MLLMVSAYLECDFWLALFKTRAFVIVLELRIFWFTEYFDHDFLHWSALGHPWPFKRICWSTPKAGHWGKTMYPSLQSGFLLRVTEDEPGESRTAWVGPARDLWFGFGLFLCSSDKVKKWDSSAALQTLKRVPREEVCTYFYKNSHLGWNQGPNLFASSSCLSWVLLFRVKSTRGWTESCWCF